MDTSILHQRNIKISTFNLMNLASPEKPYYNRKYSQHEYDKKVEWISRHLTDLNSDIVGFQEIFHREALEEVLEKAGYKNAHIVMEDTDGDRPVLGCVSRFPIESVDIFKEFPENCIINIDVDGSNNEIRLPFKYFSRPVLKVAIRIRPAVLLHFYVVHLKSKRPTYFENEDRNDPITIAKGQARSLMMRTAEATALRGLLMKELRNSENPVIVVGDVNDSGLAVTTKIISGEPPQRRLPVDAKLKVWDTLLYHVKDIQARRSYHDFYYTHIHNGHYESLDQIMVSEEFVVENPRHIGRVGYISLLNDHLIDQTLSNERPAPWHTDHGIVSVVIEMISPNKNG